MKTKTPFLRTQANFNFGDCISDTENHTSESMTVPDMSMSIKDILARHVRGLPIPSFLPSYSDEEFPDLDRMDLADKQEYIEQNVAYIKDLRSQAQAENIARQTSILDAEQKTVNTSSLKSGEADKPSLAEGIKSTT